MRSIYHHRTFITIESLESPSFRTLSDIHFSAVLASKKLICAVFSYSSVQCFTTQEPPGPACAPAPRAGPTSAGRGPHKSPGGPAPYRVPCRLTPIRHRKAPPGWLRVVRLEAGAQILSDFANFNQVSKNISQKYPDFHVV